jgi:hypothetical protein
VKNQCDSHISKIKRLIVTLRNSPDFHALIVEGPAGWGKTTAVDEALKAAGVEGIQLGAYSTPLNLYNCLAENWDRFIVIDDCAGLFGDQTSMAILKAASWPQGGRRTLKWGSTTSRAAVDKFEFKGKLIIVCNRFPNTADAEAVRSRSFPYTLELSLGDAKLLLESAARDKKWFQEINKSKAVARYLNSRLTQGSLGQISYRTLRMGYELAVHNPDSWEQLLKGLLKFAPEDPKQVVRKLTRQRLRVKDQVRLFEEATGMKRRTFFNYRREIKTRV